MTPRKSTFTVFSVGLVGGRSNDKSKGEVPNLGGWLVGKKQRNLGIVGGHG